MKSPLIAWPFLFLIGTAQFNFFGQTISGL